MPLEATQKVHTWWDLGMSDATSIIFMQKINKEWHLVDYYENSGESLEHYVNILQNKSMTHGYTYGEHYAPHDIEVRELGTGQSRLEVAKKLGIRFNIAPNISIADGINAVRRRFNTLWIDQTRCQLFIDHITLYRKEWDEKRGTFRDQPFHDYTSHSADALRYWAVTTLKEARPRVERRRPRPISPYEKVR